MSMGLLTRQLSSLSLQSRTPQSLSWRANGVCCCQRLSAATVESRASAVALETVCGKIKTRKAVSKRFKVTASGKIQRRRPGKQHINQKMTRSKLRKLGKLSVVGERDLPNIAPNLPYSGVKQSRN